MKKRVSHILLLLVVMVGALGFLFFEYAPQQLPLQEKEVARVPHKGHSRRTVPHNEVGPAEGSGDKAANESQKRVESTREKDVDSVSEEITREAEEEKLVDAFDALTDKWMEPAAKGVSMGDVQKFISQFKKIPKSRKDECLHRALNLIPDENVMLLVGILMDKSLDKEVLELVYSDMLNRDEDIKKPVLQQIFRDKSHPCWADTAWILDVTGEIPRRRDLPRQKGMSLECLGDHTGV